MTNISDFKQSTRQCIIIRKAVSVPIFIQNCVHQVYATGEDEIIEWNYDRTNENNTTIVYMPHDVDAPSEICRLRSP